MLTDQLLISPENRRAYAEDRRTERPLRSVAKSVSWRVIGTLDTILISWLITGTARVALSIGLVELFTKMLLYFFHERMWNLIPWGK